MTKASRLDADSATGHKQICHFRSKYTSRTLNFDIHQHCRSIEASTMVPHNYMSNQKEINERMRAVLVNALVRIHLSFKLPLEALYLAINIMDRYLAKVVISKAKLVLVGVSSLMIASKCQDSGHPGIKRYARSCSKMIYENPLGEDKQLVLLQLAEMERDILGKLEYKVTIPSAYCFLMQYLNLNAHHHTPLYEKNENTSTKPIETTFIQLSSFILEGTLLRYDMLLQYKPSQLASVAIFLARQKLGRDPWPNDLIEYTKYGKREITSVASDICVGLEASTFPYKVSTVNQKDKEEKTNLCAVTEKYSRKRYGCVALLVGNTRAS